MPKVKQSVERIEIIDDLISSSKRILGREEFVKQLNKRLEEPISISSLDKDLKYLRDLLETSDSGVSLLADPINGYRYSEPGFSYFKSAITDSEKQFLELGYNLFDIFSGTELQHEFGHLIQKLLKKKLSRFGNEIYLKQIVALVDRPNVQGKQWLKLLIDAIINKESLMMLYKSRRSGVTEKKSISPYLLKPYQGCWYMIAYDEDCKRNEKTNVYALHSIESLEINNHKFHDPDFDINDYFKHSLGVWHWHEKLPVTVRLEFSDYADEVRLSPIHRTQVELPSKNPKRLRIEINVFESPELERLILGFGDKVKVITPKLLAVRIKKTAGNIAGLYK